MYYYLSPVFIDLFFFSIFTLAIHVYHVFHHSSVMYKINWSGNRQNIIPNTQNYFRTINFFYFTDDLRTLSIMMDTVKTSHYRL